MSTIVLASLVVVLLLCLSIWTVSKYFVKRDLSLSKMFKTIVVVFFLVSILIDMSSLFKYYAYSKFIEKGILIAIISLGICIVYVGVYLHAIDAMLYLYSAIGLEYVINYFLPILGIIVFKQMFVVSYFNNFLITSVIYLVGILFIIIITKCFFFDLKGDSE